MKQCNLKLEEGSEKTIIEALINGLYSKLDPFIRFQLQKRGITIIQNVYVGFDTEFEMEDQQKHLNRLLSVQHAVQSRTLVKVPLYTLQNISYIHPLTNDLYDFYEPKDPS